MTELAQPIYTRTARVLDTVKLSSLHWGTAGHSWKTHSFLTVNRFTFFSVRSRDRAD